MPHAALQGKDHAEHVIRTGRSAPPACSTWETALTSKSLQSSSSGSLPDAAAFTSRKEETCMVWCSHTMTRDIEKCRLQLQAQAVAG